MMKCITDYQNMGNKAKGKHKKRWINDLLNDIKIIRMTNCMKNARNGEVWKKLKSIKSCRAT
jgi:hypothetical protein